MWFHVLTMMMVEASISSQLEDKAKAFIQNQFQHINLQEFQ